MSLDRTCARCATPLPDEAPEGSVCEECAAVLESEQTMATPPEGAGSVSYRLPTQAVRAEVLGDFEIGEKLGQGGMGAVYRARQVSLDRVVALKVLPEYFATDEENVARFQREARIAAGLIHGNVVHVFSSGVVDGTHFIAMELVEGENLRQRMKRERLSIPEALHICAEVARGLEYGWEKAHLVHRDIKPGNIFLSTDGAVKVGDLGLAKSVSGVTSGLTQTGTSLGTALYMSPEQVRGDKTFDFRSDIYSLGCTLYEMLTGQPPYSGSDGMAVMRMHLDAPLPAILKAMPGCPISLARLVGKMLKKTARERHPSYADLIAEIEMVREQIESGVTNTGPSKVVEAWKQVGDLETKPGASYGLLWAGLALLLVVGAAIAFFVVNQKDERPAAKAPVAKTSPVPTAKPVPTAAANLAGASAAAPIPQPKQWIDATADVRSRGVSEGKLKVVGDWLEAPAKKGFPLANQARFSNVAARVIFAGSVTLKVRQRVELGAYSAHVESYNAPAASIRLGRDGPPNTGAELLSGSKSFPVSNNPDESHELMLVVNAQQVSMWVDGKQLAAASDTRLTEGAIEVVFEARPNSQPSRIKRIEYGNLDGLPEADALKLVGVASAAGSRGSSPPATASTESGWIPLWNREEDARDQWENGSLKLNGTIRASKHPFYNGALRASVKHSPRVEETVEMSVRDRGAGKRITLALRANDPGLLVLRAVVGGKTGGEPLKEWRLNPPVASGEWLPLELRVVGPQIRVSARGAVLGTVSDDTVTDAGDLTFFAKGGRVRDIACLPLDGIPEADALKLAGVAPTAEPWQDLLRDPAKLALGGAAKLTADGIAFTANGAVRSTNTSQHNGAIRIKATYGPIQFPISLREKGGVGVYGLKLRDAQRVSLDRTDLATGQNTDLQTWPLPVPVQLGQEYELEFRAVDQVLSAKFNGQLLGTVSDSAFSTGGCGVHASGPNTSANRIKSVEILNLDGLAAADALKLAGGAAPSPAASGEWHDLLAGVDLTRAAVAGTWKKVADGIELEKLGGPGVLEFNDPAPSDYEYEIEFTPTTSSGNNVNQHLSMGGHSFIWKMNAHARKPPVYGLDMVDGKNCSDPSGVGATHDIELQPGKRYASRVVIHPGQIQAFFNGVEYLTWAGDPQRLSTNSGDAPPRDPQHLGLGSWGRGVIFHRAVVRALPAAGTSAPAVADASANRTGATALTFGGHRYQLVQENLGWTEAKAKAEQMGGHLVVIETAEENDWIRRTFVDPLSEGKMFWIGATNSGPDGKWRWVTGEEITFAGWAPDILEQKRLSEPNSSSGFCRNMKQGIGWSLWGHTSGGVARNVGFLVEWDDAGSASATPATATKDAPFVNSLGMKFVPVPITGGPTGGKRVLFSVWETRVQDYEPFVSQTKRSWTQPFFEQGPTHPAVSMKFQDAADFCRWLTERERQADRIGANQAYRLPSDHEWSCAAGIGDREDAAKSPREKSNGLRGSPWGTQWPPPAGSGNFGGEERREVAGRSERFANDPTLTGYRDDFIYTAPVGSFAPNALGLHDLDGNVAEWCPDRMGDDGNVTRGGGWVASTQVLLESSYRGTLPAAGSDSVVGFRVVLAPAE